MTTSWAEFLQRFSSPAMDKLVYLITSFGSEHFYVAALAFIYWIWDKHKGYRLAMVLLSSMLVNNWLKFACAIPRPQPSNKVRVIFPETGGGYAFPSGHAQGSTAFWGFLALKLKTPLAYVGAAVLIFLISFSRIYLAVHWPIDVLGGVAIGLLLLVAYSPLAQIDLLKIRLRTWIVGSIIAAAILYLLHPAGDGPLTVGFLLGALIGYRLELLYIQFKEEAAPLQNLIKAVLGLAVLFLLKEALKPVVGWLPEGFSVVVRYCLLGLWATLGAPFVFTKLGLYKKGHRTVVPH
ncbi:MAG TPA: hypothetical protein DCG91_01815 [Clostridiales bacterium UBA9857]|nr:hypothetical protein [Clostridiales bacterium UBA9857]